MKRLSLLNAIKSKFDNFPAVALLGPRQVGKTTLARDFADLEVAFKYQTNYFDLEDPTALLRLQNPKLALSNLEGLVIIDEIQRRPELFPVLRFLLDRPENKMRLLILGSASKDLIHQSSESLAGRISYLEVSPFALSEKLNIKHDDLWLRGGFPRAVLNKSDQSAFDWLEAYTLTYLERDIPALGIRVPPSSLRRFWQMLTHNHGQTLNLSQLARSFGVADTTIRNYIDILEGTFMIRSLKPYFANLSKRQVKTPKIYFKDSGVLHYLLGIRSIEQLTTHISLGASWEGFALEQVIQFYGVSKEYCFFWRTHQGSEMDLLIEKDGKLHAFEFKYADQPKVTKSMKTALKDLEISSVTIVIPGEGEYLISEKVKVRGLQSFFKS